MNSLNTSWEAESFPYTSLKKKQPSFMGFDQARADAQQPEA